jgi:hypothetical protein
MAVITDLTDEVAELSVQINDLKYAAPPMDDMDTKISL